MYLSSHSFCTFFFFVLFLTLLILSLGGSEPGVSWWCVQLGVSPLPLPHTVPSRSPVLPPQMLKLLKVGFAADLLVLLPSFVQGGTQVQAMLLNTFSGHLCRVALGAKAE